MAGRPSDHRRPRRLRWSALLVVAAVVAACGGGGADSARSVSQDPRAEENLAYGVAPAPDDSVTLQDDVVIVAGGGEPIRGVDDGGLTWLLDPDADGAGDLEVDKVMFV